MITANCPRGRDSTLYLSIYNEFVVTEKMVLYQLEMLDISKSAGPDDYDDINARMLKELAV